VALHEPARRTDQPAVGVGDVEARLCGPQPCASEAAVGELRGKVLAARLAEPLVVGCVCGGGLLENLAGDLFVAVVRVA
jgi:hypothetical protein